MGVTPTGRGVPTREPAEDGFPPVRKPRDFNAERMRVRLPGKTEGEARARRSPAVRQQRLARSDKTSAESETCRELRNESRIAKSGPAVRPNRRGDAAPPPAFFLENDTHEDGSSTTVEPATVPGDRRRSRRSPPRGESPGGRPGARPAMEARPGHVPALASRPPWLARGEEAQRESPLRDGASGRPEPGICR